MNEFWNSLLWLERLYLIVAVVGGLLFVIRTLMMFIGGDSDADFDVDADADVDSAGGMADSDISFHYLSLQGLTAFFMMFGLVGLALSRNTGLSGVVSISGGVVAGLLAEWVIAKIFKMMSRLQSDGTVHVKNAIGQEGTVYLRIQPGGTGKVRVVVQDQLKIYNAVSESDEEFKTDDRVKVVRITNGNVLVVEKVIKGE